MTHTTNRTKPFVCRQTSDKGAIVLETKDGLEIRRDGDYTRANLVVKVPKRTLRAYLKRLEAAGE